MAVWRLGRQRQHLPPWHINPGAALDIIKSKHGVGIGNQQHILVQRHTEGGIEVFDERNLHIGNRVAIDISQQ